MKYTYIHTQTFLKNLRWQVLEVARKVGDTKVMDGTPQH